MHYIRIGVFLVKTPQDIPLRLMTQNSPKDSSEVKKQQVEKTQNEKKNL